MRLDRFFDFQMFFLDSLVFLLVVVLVSFFTGDEEPIFDVSDLNLFHIFLITVSLGSVFFDNLIKMYAGQTSNSDRQVFSYVGFKWLAMLFYFGIIWLGFFSHVMTPMLTGCAESTIYVTKVLELCSNTFILMLTLCFVYIMAIDILVTSGQSILFKKAFSIFVLSVIKDSWFCTWEILGKGPSLVVNDKSNDESPVSLKSQSALTYNSNNFNDGFDWHKVVSKPMSVLFVEISHFFFLVLVLLIILVMSILVIVMWLNPTKKTTTQSSNIDATISTLVYIKSMVWVLIIWVTMGCLFLWALSSRSLLSSSVFSWI